MTFQEFKQIVVAKAQEMGLTDYELYYQASESTSVSAFQHEVNQFTSSIEGGVCFRCIVGGKMGYASTEELSEAQAVAVVEKEIFPEGMVVLCGKAVFMKLPPRMNGLLHKGKSSFILYFK